MSESAEKSDNDRCGIYVTYVASIMTRWLSATGTPLSTINASHGSGTVSLLQRDQKRDNAALNLASIALSDSLSVRHAETTYVKSAKTTDKKDIGMRL